MLGRGGTLGHGDAVPVRYWLGRSGGDGFVVLPRRWWVELRCAWIYRSSRCYDVLCEVEAAWIGLFGIRRLMRSLASDGS